MTKSTIEGIEGMDSVNIENIPTHNLEEILEGINKEIEELQRDREIVSSELERRGESL